MLHPVGDKDPATYWRRRALTGVVVLVFFGLISVGAVLAIRSGPSTPDSGSAASRPSMAATIASATPSPSTPTPTPTPSETSSKKEKKKQKKDAEPDWTQVPGASSQDGDWATYPWGSNGQECPAPISFPASSKSPSDPGVVVVLGDSLIRNSRDAIASSLNAYGMSAQFVCWGGKNLEWGLLQVQTMRSLGLLPACLVINLGTNDLKGTTATDLADAVAITTVGQRLQEILIEASDINHVFAVDIAADLSLAPSTMASVGEAPQVWQDAVSATGVGEVIPWSSSATADPSLFDTDGIHDSGSGQQVRAQLIAEAVAPYCSA